MAQHMQSTASTTLIAMLAKPVSSKGFEVAASIRDATKNSGTPSTRKTPKKTQSIMALIVPNHP